MAGTGKSAVAHTVAGQFDKLKRLGSCYSFSRAEAAKRHPGNFFSTISIDIADLDKQWKKHLCDAIQDKHATRTSASPQLQFETFILEPSHKLPTVGNVGPILIVVDAIDESADEGSEFRKKLIDILSEQTAQLPSNFRILVTGRPDEDIEKAFKEKPDHIKWMDITNAKSTDEDISKFIEHQLADVAELGDDRTGAYRRLLDSSGGLFQWVFTACWEIKNPRNGQSALEHLNNFASGKALGLDALYLGILRRAFVETDAAALFRFVSVLGPILVSREPLSMSSLSKLRRDNESSGLVKSVLRPLGSLLSGVTEDSIRVRPLHTSFRDFLTDKSRSRAFYVDIRSQDACLGLACLRVMNTELQFNMCEFPNSHLSNDDVPDLVKRVESKIPPHLSYACRFWAHHLREGASIQEVSAELEAFFKERLLFWLEIQSLTQQVGAAAEMLRLIVIWVKVSIFSLSNRELGSSPSMF